MKYSDGKSGNVQDLHFDHSEQSPTKYNQKTDQESPNLGGQLFLCQILHLGEQIMDLVVYRQ